ncbi:MAG: hypothetical protein QXQ18_02730 [Candidatus Aenigmatarchaeota archaeon]
MGFIKEIFGLALVFIAWFNFFDLSLPIRILIFILGFDMMSIALKLGVFVISFFGFFPYFAGFSNLAFTLLILVAIEIILTIFLIGYVFTLILKPLAVFLVAFLAGLDINLVLILASIDLILNIPNRK